MPEIPKLLKNYRDRRELTVRSYFARMIGSLSFRICVTPGLAIAAALNFRRFLGAFGNLVRPLPSSRCRTALTRANLPLWPRNLSVRNVICRNGNAPVTDTAGYARVSMRSGCAKTGNTIAVPAVNPAICRPNIRQGSEWRASIADIA